jgi:predicted N-acyltransferase
MTKPALQIRVVPKIAEIQAADWDACANPSKPESQDGAASTATSPYNPFISHAFLSSLEDSGSATGRTGWQPQHLALEGTNGSIIGVVPAYLKSHSQGEYVFDRGWAEAFERAGGDYYPKVQVSVPFTPATGRRLLSRPGGDEETVRAALLAGLVELSRVQEASSAHITFMPEDEWKLAAERGFLQRTDQQFHWLNNGYESFGDFLGELASRKRKLIRRERRDAVANGIEIVRLTGKDLTEAAWDAFFEFYMETGSRKWGRPYLTRSFYSLIGKRMPQDILLVMAKRAGRYIAGAINFIGGDTLYGRHWGAVEHHPFLHFEVCYYQAIDFAIARKLRRVEAGAQGEHKLARGYLPQTTYSAHYIADEGFRRAVADYLKRERQYVAAAGEELTELSPFRKNLAGEEAEQDI